MAGDYFYLPHPVYRCLLMQFFLFSNFCHDWW